MIRFFFSSHPCSVMFRCLPPQAPDPFSSTWWCCAHTCLRGKGREPRQMLYSSCWGLSDLSSASSWLYAVMTSLWWQENFSWWALCILIAWSAHRARRGHVCSPSFTVNQLCDSHQIALFCCDTVLDKVEWGVIPVPFTSGVWWKANVKLDVKVLWEFQQWVRANQNAGWILSVFPICMLPVSTLSHLSIHFPRHNQNGLSQCICDHSNPLIKIVNIISLPQNESCNSKLKWLTKPLAVGALHF